MPDKEALWVGTICTAVTKLIDVAFGSLKRHSLSVKDLLKPLKVISLILKFAGMMSEVTSFLATLDKLETEHEL